MFLLPSQQIVVRLSGDSSTVECARRNVSLSKWLISQGFPAPAPSSVEQPVQVGNNVVTFWRHYPQGDRPRPGASALGVLLRQLHQLPSPPVKLEPYQPLQSLGVTLEKSVGLSDSDKTWLFERRHVLLTEYGQLEFPLGVGFIHGDAYPGNTLWDGSRPLLGDWDEFGTGPRELDLANTHQGARFGRTQEERDAFAASYGYDVTSWEGFGVLREMRDLHTLGAYIRRADAGDDDAAAELAFRVDTLRRGDTAARWNAR
ncbi:aminoglycoside phosphotransferase family protein [Amycolatopsis suaedae]|uniref:Aminoglycoside phosphotransferase family protein n=1 Tax=Amycolatopsis suaedae TaxID=2510978 RepID=A0A4Q7J9K9_9PSEU|nr:aminoglycoside phosphotransferase family protein [Amycolatopsis suaedae]